MLDAEICQRRKSACDESKFRHNAVNGYNKGEGLEEVMYLASLLRNGLPDKRGYI